MPPGLVKQLAVASGIETRHTSNFRRGWTPTSFQRMATPQSQYERRKNNNRVTAEILG